MTAVAQSSRRAAGIAEAEPTAPGAGWTAEFLGDVLRGLRKEPKELPCKYLYDDRGSSLFDRICELEEYYPTRTELAIMREYARSMADSLGERCLLVEYGSGSSIKTRWLLDHLAHPVAYVPLDISHAHLLRAAHSLSAAYPGLPVLPLCADFTLPFALPRAPSRPRRTVVYFPGSSVGNFHPHEAAAFLSQARRVVGASGALLIGVDLEKDPALLERAYNDGAGVTAEFNRNVLARINRELGAGFDLDEFRHHALYDRDLRRIEMHLISMHDQIARIGSERVAFRRGESIITEYSYKYPPGGFERLAARAGFNHRRTWTDAAGLFGVHLFDAAT